MQVEHKGLSVFTIGYLALSILLLYAGIKAMNNEWWGSFEMDENVYNICILFSAAITMIFASRALMMGFMVHGAILGVFGLTFFLTSFCDYYFQTTTGLLPFYFTLCVIMFVSVIMSARSKAMLPLVISALYIVIAVVFYIDENLIYMASLFLTGIVAIMYSVFNWMHFQDISQMTDIEVLRGLFK